MNTYCMQAQLIWLVLACVEFFAVGSSSLAIVAEPVIKSCRNAGKYDILLVRKSYPFSWAGKLGLVIRPPWHPTTQFVLAVSCAG